MRHILALLVGAAMLSGPALAPPAMAAAPSRADAAFLKSCQTQMYLSAAGCACVLSKAQSQLDEKEIAYLTIPGSDGPDAARAAKSLSGGEVGRIDKFMRTVPDQCEKAP